MRSILLVGSLLVGMASADDLSHRTPDAEFAELLKEYDAAMADWKKLLRGEGHRSAWIPKSEKMPTWKFAPGSSTSPRQTRKVSTAVECAGQRCRAECLGREIRAVFRPTFSTRNLLIQHHLEDKRVVQIYAEPAGS